jgi:hypothetical protein
MMFVFKKFLLHENFGENFQMFLNFLKLLKLKTPGLLWTFTRFVVKLMLLELCLHGMLAYFDFRLTENIGKNYENGMD